MHFIRKLIYLFTHSTLDFRTLFYILNVATSLILIFSALLMWFLTIPPDPQLKNYRVSRRAIACAYLIFGLFSGADAFFNSPDSTESDMFIVALVSLVIASFQSFLFTYTLIVLINPSFFTRRWLTGQLIPISGFSLVSFLLLFLAVPSLEKPVFYLFLAFYLYQLTYYSRTFIREYKRYRFAAGNYFSDDKAKHLRWVAVAFFSALGVGVMALVLIVYPNPVCDLVVATLCSIFYAYFLIKYINYPYVFRHVIMAEEESPEGRTDANPGKDKAFGDLSCLLEQWIGTKAYMEPNITIVNLAGALNTNRTYLSAYINSTMQMNFNAWINFLRTEEAKKILQSEDQLSIADIASRLGYTDHSSFSRQFKKNTGFSPVEWRRRK